jgi:hypothetical protein
MSSFVIVPLLHSVRDILIADTLVGCLRRHIRPVGYVLAAVADKVNTDGIGWFVRTSWSPRGPVLCSPARPQRLLLLGDVEVCDKGPHPHPGDRDRNRNVVCGCMF